MDVRAARARSSNGGAALTVALAFHALLIGLGAVLPAPVASPPSVPIAPSDTDVVELEPPSTPSVPEREGLRSIAPTRPPDTPHRGRAAIGVRHLEEGAPAVADDDARPEPSVREGDFDEPALPPTSTLPLGLSLRQRIGVPSSPPAPTEAPRRAPVTGEDVTHALRSELRQHDVAGLQNPEEHFVATAVKDAMRETPVPSKTRARFLVDVDAAGKVTAMRVVSASAGTAEQWSETIGRARAALSSKPIPLGPDARQGVKIAVDATLLHVYMSGSDGTPVVGPCPTMPLIGGEKPNQFFATGGAPYGEDPTGTCLLYEAGGHKHIEVRATVTSLIGLPAPSVADFPVRPKRKVRLLELVFGRH